MNSTVMLAETMRIFMFKPFKFWADYAEDEHSIWTACAYVNEVTPPPQRIKLQIFTPEIRKNLMNMTKNNTEVTSPIVITTPSPVDLQKRRLSLETLKSLRSPVNSPDSISSPSPRKTKIMSLGNFKPLISPTTPRRRRKS